MYQFIYFPSGDTWILALFCVLSRGQSEKAIIQIHMGTIFFNQLTKKKKKKVRMPLSRKRLLEVKKNENKKKL